MPKGEIVKECCGQYESECRCEDTREKKNLLLTDEEIMVECGMLSINYRKVAKAQLSIVLEAYEGYLSSKEVEAKVNQAITATLIAYERTCSRLIEDAKKQERERIADQITFDGEDVHIFDTSYGYNQVRIDYVFINEDSELWKFLKSQIGGK